MSVYENFVSLVGSQLVLPRRNIGRAISRMEEAGMPSGNAEWTALDYALEALDGIVALEVMVREADKRTIHVCSCGHSHYVRTAAQNAEDA